MNAVVKKVNNPRRSFNQWGSVQQVNLAALYGHKSENDLDEYICEMAEYYQKLEHGRYVMQSDALDH